MSDRDGHAAGHAAGHDHSRLQAEASRTRLAWALGITGTILVVEVIGGFLSGSLALLADAGHMATDSIGLVIALIAASLMTRPRSTNRTWGWARMEVLAATGQALLLFVVCASILWESLHRLAQPAPVQSGPMLIVGVIGLTANVASMAILYGGRGNSLNMRAAFLEVLTDALGSIAVIVASIVLITTGWPYADSVASLLIAAMIVPRVFSLLRGSLSILMESSPRDLDVDELERHLLTQAQVASVHDLHASTIGTGVVSVTAHVVLVPGADAESAAVLADIQTCIRKHFPGKINHLTVQIDSSDGQCAQVLTH